MALLTVSGEPGCQAEEAARLTAQRLHFELFAEPALRRLMEEQFGPEAELPDRAYPHVLAFILFQLAMKHHLVACFPDAEFVLRQYPASLRARAIAPASYRTGTLMVERGLQRPAAAELLVTLDRRQRDERRRRFGRATTPPQLLDVTLNSAQLDGEAMAEVLVAAARARALPDLGLLAPPLTTQIEFGLRLQLARYRIHPPGPVDLQRKAFVHPSEEIFASLLDFYRISWEYEPRSFPLQWDHQGNVAEAFTPDFYLPEYDLYVELTTMKQALVTRKNRKIRRLRKLYPDVSIQVFYQKDFENLIFKHGLTSRPAEA